MNDREFRHRMKMVARQPFTPRQAKVYHEYRMRFWKDLANEERAGRLA